MFTDKKQSKQLWAVHHNNNALRIMQGTPVVVNQPYVEDTLGIMLNGQLTFMSEHEASHWVDESFEECGLGMDCEYCDAYLTQLYEDARESE